MARRRGARSGWPGTTARGLRAALLLALLGLAEPAWGTISYRVSVERPEEHFFRVTMTVPAVEDELILQMPAWNALYQIRDFAARVQNVRAYYGDDQALEVRKLDKLTWRMRLPRSVHRVRVEYSSYWDDAGPFSAQLDAQHGFANLALILMYVPSRRGEDTRIEFTGLPAGWRTAVALQGHGAGFRAASYDALVDAPVEMGQFEEWRFEANGARIRVAAHGAGYDRATLTDMLKRVVTYQTKLMREVPFEEYLFIYHFGAGGGGMEHANSTAISTGGSPESVTAHEFFHLWNVKRIRPQSLEPLDHTREMWTRSLWFAEGVTSTYGDFTLVRSGLITAERYWEGVARGITQLQSRPARLWQSVEQSSLDAWHERYREYRGTAFSISYYNKGEILGLLLDILIRDATDNKKSLDDVLRDLNETYARQGKFYPESAGIRAAAERVAQRSFVEFFDKYVAGTEELPYVETFKLAGLTFGQGGTGRDTRYELVADAQATAKARRIRDGIVQGTNE